jgi:signal transduction histidine kinase
MTQGAAGRGLLPALQVFVEQFSQQSGLEVELRTDVGTEAVALSPEVEVQLVRVIQEALANIRKHARATRAVVGLRRTDGGVRLSIEDNGRGFSLPGAQRTGAPRFGLQIMRERAEALGGSFEIQSEPGKGSTFTVTIPVSLKR